MPAVIDLLQDVEQKFYGTIIMYDNKAAIVKSVGNDPEIPGEFTMNIAIPGTRAVKLIKLSDPLLNFKDFNIGYVNCDQRSTWWYRKPSKQWAQGLKANQMGYKVDAKGVGPTESFGPSRPFFFMLENNYPNIEHCKKLLMDDKFYAASFHKDFALSFDDLHEDFLLEYHGTRIGTSLDKDLKQFKIKSEFRHLVQALQEARNVHG